MLCPRSKLSTIILCFSVLQKCLSHSIPQIVQNLNQLALCSLIKTWLACLMAGCYTLPLLPSRETAHVTASLMLCWPLSWCNGPLPAQKPDVVFLLNCARSRFKPWPVPIMVKHKCSIHPCLSLGMLQAAELHPDTKRSLQTYLLLPILRVQVTNT